MTPIAVGDILCFHQWYEAANGNDPALQEGEQMWGVVTGSNRFLPLVYPDRLAADVNDSWMVDHWDNYEIVPPEGEWPDEVCVYLSNKALFEE